MKDQNIELPPLPKFDRLSSMHADDVARLLSSYGRKCASAAIEADRKYLAEEYRKELDKLSQRNYELRMENAQLLADPVKVQSN